jgi:hypothetical protein
MNKPRLLTTLRGRTEAPLHAPNDCSTRARGRLLIDHTTAVSPKHAGPFRLRLRSQRRRFASNARLNPPAEAQASNSRAAALYLSLYPSYHIVFPSNEPRLELAAAWSWNWRRSTREVWERGGLDQVVPTVSGGDGGSRRSGAM